MTLRPRKIDLLRWLPKTIVLTHGPSRDKAIYLTFDDGPHPQHTPALLDLLRAHDARASFFLIGREAEHHPQLVERIVAEGHQLGNHSYNHPVFNALSHAEQWAEIVRTERVLASFDGRTRHRFRPPRGVFSPALALRFAWSRRNLAYWSYDSLDYQGRMPDELAAQLRERPPVAGEVLLMHDDSDCSRRMLETLLPEWRNQGFSFPVLPAH